MEEIDISPFAYGLLALSNPESWTNEEQCEEYKFLITGKSVYVWPLIFAAYVQHLENRNALTFEADLQRIDTYTERHFATFLAENPVDFSNAGAQYMKSKPGSFQALRAGFGTAVKKLKIPEAEKMLTAELREMEKNGLIVDPFSVTAGGVALAVLGAVPYSFTQRSAKGDEKYLKISAMLWEFESLTKDEKRELRFHFFMEKAIAQLKKHVQLLVQDNSAGPTGDQEPTSE
ncbi:hypothetical protein [Phaeobacter inhibens]|uniref:hypothetical protein n=1 Tax=Phaeobacter inhibens TaxID=221822 RepID=UPI0021A6027E|nr:hypothetical protein [Phaeobacter inhibens]UWR58326.1 hypothetical protein K4F89_07810 [Phaeobacter inhibens]